MIYLMKHGEDDDTRLGGWSDAGLSSFVTKNSHLMQFGLEKRVHLPIDFSVDTKMKWNN